MRPTLKQSYLIGTATLVAGTALVTSLGAGSAGSADRTWNLASELDGGRARNVILFIGDGMGDSEITIARNYQLGARGRLTMDRLPFTGEYTTFALQESNPALVDYVTDSAASGTGWATGHKTSNGRIATVAGTTAVSPIPTILELAQRAGYKVGNVTTAELTDATPAVLDSHINNRNCQGPADMGSCAAYKKEVGGPGSIAEQSVDHRVDVLLGGGRDRFAQTITGGPFAGRTVIQAAQAIGYDVVGDKSALGAASQGRKLLGLFNGGNMTLEWSGLQAAPFPGTGPQQCVENQRELLSNEPSLAEMTTKAIELLTDDGWSRRGRRGFFLQVEGASIDKQDHVESPCQQIGETVAFDAAIKVAVNFARHNPDTLIVVTADHGHTSQIVPVPSASESVPRPGNLSTLLTKEGALMGVNYGTRAHLQSQDHTGTQVRIAAQGPQAANVVGVTDQTDLFHTLARALGLE